MLLVSMPAPAQGLDREDIDRKARQLVGDAYRGARATPIRSQEKFDAAVETYLKAYPHIARELARHAVAYIIATDGL